MRNARHFAALPVCVIFAVLPPALYQNAWPPQQQESNDMEAEKNRDQPYFYGSWTWIVGLIAAALLIWFMFSLADGFS